ncbi:MAG: uridine diphosphate-N-acetylglucosamine-binding protein YvcK [Anaerolineae bacterium]
MRFPPKKGSLLKWLYPGMQVKRWLILLTMGITILSLGFAYILVNIYREQPFPPIFYYLTLQFIPRLHRGLLFGLVGISLVLVATIKLNQSLLSVFRSPGHESLVDVVYQHRRGQRGPKVVAIGGGTGLSTLLRGLKEHTSNIVAIVTVADDGGSSGRLRRELGVLPPGDFRNCIAALSNAESLTTELFQYRFGEGMGLNGHSFGNLFIAAMAGVTGNFERAILESSRVLAVQGRILPSTLQNVTLCADLREEIGEVEGSRLRRVQGESKIPKSGMPIERVFLEPENVGAYPESVKALLEADLIVAGPGSLYTSVLPNLLVPGINQALRRSSALKIYVCNVATQLGETDGFSVRDHVRAIEEHVEPGMFPYVMVNNNMSPQLPPDWTIELIRPDLESNGEHEIVSADVIDQVNPWRHDASKLARSLMQFYYSHRER